MILVKKIEVFEFRGIRHLEIDFKKKNFAICGKNGTGKSGIVDALEFVLTGDISRLAGSGTGGISVREHAPHVDCRTIAAKSRVIVTVYIISLNREVTIERSVSDVHKPLIKPSSPEILEIISEIGAHPEFALSRRELIKYVISAPGDRAKEIQALLKLEKIENLRAILQRISNADKNAIPPLLRYKEEAKQQLSSALGIENFNSVQVLQAVNTRRLKLGLAALIELTATTSFTDGLTEQTAMKPVNVSKANALSAVENSKNALKTYQTLGNSDELIAIKKDIHALSEDKTSLNNLSREDFLRKSLSLLMDDNCPVCDSDIGMDELVRILKSKLESFESTAKKRGDLEKKLKPYFDTLDIILTDIRTLKEYATLLKPSTETSIFDVFTLVIQSKIKAIKAFLPIEELISSLSNYGEVSIDIEKLIDTIEKNIKAIPDPSEHDQARDFLIIAQQKLENYRTASSDHKKSVDQAANSLAVSTTYRNVVTSTLEGLYKEVEVNFSELYRMINEDDESAFTAKFIPSAGKLGFNVDFYGRGYFPPGAYHSEGHQDGMGLCLYLALMQHLLGDKFSFAVLDDVLMSVDAGHRREVCRMLKEKFPNTQFILTTHDEVWLKHMKTAGLIQPGGAIQFRKWDVDKGPNEWNDKDVWGEIEENLKANDVRSAAGLLRHYLEYVSAEISHKIRARVEFRGDANFMLGDLLPAATSQLTKLFDDGIKAARSWGQTNAETTLQQRKNSFKELISKSSVEQWQTNTAIHYNEWANLDGKDFTPVAQSFKNLIEAFSCTEESCQSILYVVPERGPRDTLRCACGTVTINLKSK